MEKIPSLRLHVLSMYKNMSNNKNYIRIEEKKEKKMCLNFFFLRFAFIDDWIGKKKKNDEMKVTSTDRRRAFVYVDVDNHYCFEMMILSNC